MTLAGRGQAQGRETLVFNFAPRPGQQFDDNEKYVGLLKGTIWIDAKDRVVTRLEGRPAGVKGADVRNAAPPPVEKPPAVFVEMTRSPSVRSLCIRGTPPDNGVHPTPPPR